MIILSSVKIIESEGIEMKLPLSQNDRETLAKLHKSEKNKKAADRIKAILLLDAGYTQKEIATILLIEQNTVGNWFKKFKNSGNIAKYLDDNYLPYWGKLNSHQLVKVRRYVQENIIIDSKQVIEYVKEQFGVEYSLSGMKNLLNYLGFAYKQLSLFPSKADIEKQEQFIYDYKELVENLQEDEHLFFIDGVHPQHNTHASKAWIEKGKEKHIPTNNGRNRLNLNGAYNPFNQDVIIREDSTINAQSNIKLFEMIQSNYPTSKNIYVIADNATYNRSKILKDYLKTSKIKIIYLPPYAPNLNLIERLWKFMRKKVINTKYYPDFHEFEISIINFFKNIAQYKIELKSFIGYNFHLIEPKTTLA